MIIKWENIMKIKGITVLAVSMNAFLLITVLMMYKFMLPEDPLMQEAFRIQTLIVYVVSLVAGNAILMYLYRQHINEKRERAEIEKQLHKEAKKKRKANLR